MPIHLPRPAPAEGLLTHEPWSLYLENFDDRTYNSNQDRIDRVAA